MDNCQAKKWCRKAPSYDVIGCGIKVCAKHANKYSPDLLKCIPIEDSRDIYTYSIILETGEKRSGIVLASGPRKAARKLRRIYPYWDRIEVTQRDGKLFDTAGRP